MLFRSAKGRQDRSQRVRADGTHRDHHDLCNQHLVTPVAWNLMESSAPARQPARSVARRTSLAPSRRSSRACAGA